jgi:hypothetical protein
MTRENLKNQVNSKIVNDELSEEEMMHDIMKMVDAHVTQQLILSGVSKAFVCGCDKPEISWYGTDDNKKYFCFSCKEYAN